MGKVIPFKNSLSAELGVRPPPVRKRRSTGKVTYVGLNIYIDPEPIERLQIVKRYVLHGILCSWNWKLTKRLFRQLFVEGGVFRVYCKPADIADIREQIQLRLPDLLVRRVRAA